jgi:propanediol dehydratase small subunit
VYIPINRFFNPERAMNPSKPRQERFCRRFAELDCATTAARAAGYAHGSAKVAGYRLIRHPRVAEIEAETARLHSRGDDVLVGKLDNVYRRAVIDHNFHAAARAVDLQARIRREAGRVPASAGAHAEPAERPATPRENIGASFTTVPAAARNDDFCFGGKLF